MLIYGTGEDIINILIADKAEAALWDTLPIGQRNILVDGSYIMKERNLLNVYRISEVMICVLITILFAVLVNVIHVKKSEEMPQTVEVKETENLVKIIKSYVPDCIEEYAKNNYARFYEDGEAVSLGTPYRIYVYPGRLHQSEIYQYPVYKDGKLSDTFCVMYDGQSRECIGYSKDSVIADWLAEIDYAGKNYMLYSIDMSNGLELLVAEDASGNKVYENEEMFLRLTDEEKALLDEEPYDKAVKMLAGNTEG